MVVTESQTAHLYLLGHPVSHSLSPQVYRALFAYAGFRLNYELVDCATEREARAFIDSLLSCRTPFALNVTTPYKPLLLSYASSAFREGRHLTGANLMASNGRSYLVDNTDGLGFYSVMRKCSVDVAKRPFFICGSGATARAIAENMVEAESRVNVLTRHVTRDADLGQLGKVYNYPDAFPRIKDNAVVVNATTLGMNVGDLSPVPPSVFKPGQIVCDMVYASGTTSFQNMAKAAGVKMIIPGQVFLCAQAVESFKIMTPAFNIDRRSFARAYDVACASLDFSWSDYFVGEGEE